MKSICGILILATIFPATVTQADLLVNGDFELPAGTTNWTDTRWTVMHGGRTAAAARNGERGVEIDGSVQQETVCFQDIPVTAGTYTFSMWLHAADGWVHTNLQLSITWMDAQTNSIHPASIRYLDSLPTDNLWHEAYITGSCSSNTLAYARVKLLAQYETGLPGATLHADNARFYAGTHEAYPYLVNGGFEYGQTNEPAWNGSQWSVITQGIHNSRRQWDRHSGDWASVLEGWSGTTSNRTILCQHLYPESTGTWTFSMWIKREHPMLFYQTRFFMEWRNATYTNLLQAHSTNIATLATNWTRYSFTATCTNTELFELRAGVEFVYDSDSGSSTYLDDVRVIQEPYTNPVIMDWAYHNNPRLDPTVETLPGTNACGTFLEINYAASTTVFRMLAAHPDAARYPNENCTPRMYISYRPPHLTNDTDYISIYSNMTLSGSAILSNTAFHGAPSNDVVTVDIWQYTWPHPNSNGVPYTKPFRVFYSPYLETTYEGSATGKKHLIRVGPSVSNNYPVFPQTFSTNFKDQDYYYWHQRPSIRPTFTNGGFEYPVILSNSWDQTDWSGFGEPDRGTWQAHAGQYGAWIPSWHTNDYLENNALFQPVQTTGGIYTLSAWLAAEPDINPRRMYLRLDWYSDSGDKMQTDLTDITDLPHNASWHHVYVTGTNTDPSLAYVVPKVDGCFGATTGSNARVMVDDIELYEGIYRGVHSLANPGFEQGSSNGWFSGSQWYAQRQLLGNYRSSWGARMGSWCALLDGIDTNAENFTTRIGQNMTPGTGTFTFAIWMLRDTNFIMTNAEIRLQWYDRSLTRQVQADSVTNLGIPADTAWREYFITGTCTSNDLYEVRATVAVQYTNTLVISSNAATLRMDDARFYPGNYAPALIRDWGYHCSPSNSPLMESLPGTNGFGRFMHIDYARTTTVFHVLANAPDIAPTSSVESEVGIRVAYWSAYSNDWVEVWTDMTWIGSVDLDDSTPFHGAPQSGGHTVDVFRYAWAQPLTPAGEPDTNDITVWYCPYFRTFKGDTDYEWLWLLQRGEMANDYPVDPQLFGVWYPDKDYSYTNRWTPDQDQDHIPDLWELRYYTWITNCIPGQDSDGDEHDNWNEYVADTGPRNAASYFHQYITAVSGHISAVRMDAPTTNSRLYEIYWKTNLVDTSVWTPCGLETWGSAAGTGLWFDITDKPTGSMPRIFYRLGVRMP